MSETLKSYSYRPLKEPRGFLRCIQFVTAIFAFATVAGYSTHVSVKLFCNGTFEQESQFHYYYPFRSSDSIKIKDCYNVTESYGVFLGIASAVEFYVAIGVLTFLYCMATLSVYIIFNKMYQDMDIIRAADFIIGCVIAVMWLISSSSWANSLIYWKNYGNPEYIMKNTLQKVCASGSCEDGYGGNYANPNVSVIFGFLNMVIWIGNLWFLYKETSWFHGSEPPPNTNPNPNAPPQRV